MNNDDVNIASINDIEALSGPNVSILLQQARDVRLQRVNWQAYLQSDLINEEHYKVITALDNASTDQSRNHAISRDEDQVAKVLLFLLNKLTKEQALQYTLTLVDDLLQEDKSRANIFTNYFVRREESLWPHFFAMLQKSDLFCMFQASRIITKIACWASLKMERNDLEYFYSWIQGQLFQKDNKYILTVARDLQMLLRIPQYRDVFVERNGIELISDLLVTKSKEQQLSYQIIFCLWLLSFKMDHAVKMLKVGNLIPIVGDIFCDGEKEKIIRICVALFRVIVEKVMESQKSSDIRDCCVTLVQCKVLKRLENLSQKDFSHDKELSDDLEFLKDKLTNSVQDVSSLEEYTSELKSGRLEWSPVHKSEKFWRENAINFTVKNYELLKMLIHLMKNSQDATIVSVAAHDIGEFVRHYPRGKQLIEEMGAKTYVMSLLAHEDANVRYNALISVQKIMLHNWEHMGRQLKDPSQDAVSATGPRGK